MLSPTPIQPAAAADSAAPVSDGPIAAVPAAPPVPASAPASEPAPEPLHRRNDTFLGVCEAIGEDFGIPANLLRLAFAALFFFQQAGAIGLYVLLGLGVYLSRRLFPKPAARAPLAAAASIDPNPRDRQEPVPFAEAA